MLSTEELQQGLQTRIFGKKVFSFDAIDSTNTCAKTLAIAGMEEGTVVIAEYQTAGRGRFGKLWQAESGSNLLFSLIIRPTLDNKKVGLLPLFAVAGVALAIESITGLHCECKWPNDLLLNGKKCCGILMESAFQNNSLDYAVIGIGLNVNQKSFSKDLEDRATSLNIECGKEFDSVYVFRQIMTSLESLYMEVRIGNFDTTLKRWKSRIAMFGKQITLTQANKETRGHVIALAADGGLILETTEGQLTFYAGDVTIKKD